MLFKVRDRAKKEWVLGPTHEEVITTLVAGEINSYRQMPKNFYQIQTKFRDEIRPRFGLMRAKEFIMKDAYSFDATDEAAQASYQQDVRRLHAHLPALRPEDASPVEADTGVMGGKFSHEFMVPAETGENEVVFCEACGYAANVEKATSGSREVRRPKSDVRSREVRHARRGHHRGAEQGALQRAGRPADQDAGLSSPRASSVLDPAARRRPVERGQARRRARHGDVPARPTPEEIFAALGAHPGSLGRRGRHERSRSMPTSACATPPT